MKKFILLSIVLLSLLVAPLSEVFAQARLINYQGNILNQEKSPFNGPVQITFELYSAEFGGSQLWSEIQNVTLNNGYFNVYLGSVSPFASNFNFNRDLWLQVTVGKGSPYQRTMLSMVPYSGYSDRAARAGFADTVADASITLAKLSDQVINMGGDLTGQLPNPRLRPGAILEGIPDGSITQAKLDPNVTVRPSGPASGDLTGFYPDPQIAAGAVKTDRIADGAVINSKIADFTIMYNKLQNAKGPIGTILGWDGTKWIETNVPAWEIGRIKAIVAGDGTYINNVTDVQNFLTTTVGIADAGVTTAKIADDAVTYAKVQNAVGANGTILAWNGTNWVENTVPALEADAVIGNEVLNATPNLGLVRAGAGTVANPFTLGIADGGVVTKMIAMDAVTYDKLQNAAGPVGTILSWNGGHWVENNVPALEADGIIGNELLDATLNRGLVRAGAGTTANPYTIGIAEEGIVNSMIEWNTIAYDKFQNAAGPIGTIIGWNGTDWIETNVPAWEKGKVMAVTAGAGTTVMNTTDAGGFISAQVGIANQGVTNAMLAPGAVSLDKLAAGNQIGQIMWWDNAANQWRYSTGAAPVQDYVIKWIDAGGSLTPRWAPDDMTLPYEKTITENAQTLFAITNNGNSDVMSLTTTGKGDGLGINLTEDLTGGGYALHLNGAGFEQPSLMIERNTNYGLPEGAATINATINSLDAESAGLIVNTTIIDDGNNAYDVEGIQSLLNITNGVNDVFYTGVWGVGNSDNGIATGVWGDANGVNTQSNFGVVGAAYDAANTNIGVTGVANDANYQAYTTLLPPGFGAGVVAMNAGTTTSDFGVFADVKGDGTGVQAQSETGSGLVAANESDLEPTVFAFNNGTNSVFVGVNTSNEAPTANFMNFGDARALSAMSSTSEDIYTADISNMGDGRGLAVTGGKLNNENGGNPFFQDPTDDDDAALVVRNNMAGPGVFATAIKTYGDIWANSSIGASQIIGLNKVIVGDPLGLYIELLPPAFPGAPLTIDGDVEITGDLTVNDINAYDIFANDLMVNDIWSNEINANVINTGVLNASLGVFTDLQVDNNANVDGATTLNTLGVSGATTLNSTLTQNGGGQVTFSGNVNANNGIDVIGVTTLTGTVSQIGGGQVTFSGNVDANNGLDVVGAATVAGPTTLNGLLSQVGGGQVTFSGNVDANNGLDVIGATNVTGATTLNGTLSQVGGGQVAFSGNVDANMGLDVVGATTLTGTVNQIGGGQVTFSGNVDANNGLDVVGAATVAGPTTLTGTLSQVGGGQVTFSGNVDANMGLDVNGATNLNGATIVTGTTTLNGTLTQNGGGQVAFSGNVDANNGLDVLGTTNLTGALNQIGGAQVTISGNVDANNGLDVMGATTLGGTLGVTGAATFANDVNLNGSNLNISNGTRVIAGGVSGAAGHLFVSRGAALSPQWTNSIPSLIVTDLEADDLLVNNNAVIDGNLDVNGTTVTINANVDMIGDFDLTGKLTTEDLQVNNNTRILNEFEAVTTLFEITAPLVDITGNLGVVGNTNLTGTLGVSGNTTIGGATQINNTLGVTGNTLLGGNLRVDGTSDLRGVISNTTGDLTVVDNVNITGITTINGNLTVQGPGQGQISGTSLSLTQNATVGQNATIAQNLTVGGHTSINTLDVIGAIVNPLSAAAPVNVNDNLHVAGDVTISGGVTILGDLTANNINAILDVKAGQDVKAVRDVIAGRHLNVNNNATIGGNLGVTGNTTLSGTLGVTLGATFANTINAQGAISNSLGLVTVNDDLDVSGQVLANDLFVSNNSELNTLDVTGNISNTAGNVTVNDNLVVTGGNTITGTLVNSLTQGAGITAFTYNNGAAATVAIAPLGVVTGMLADGAVTTPKLADGAVTTAKILDLNVTTNKLADNAVEAAKIAAGSVITAKIADDAVTYAKLQNAAGAAGTILNWDGANWVETTVGALEVDGVIGNEVLNATVAGGLVRAGAGTNVDPYTLGVAPLGIVTGMIANDAVTTAKIADGAVTTPKLADNAVTTAKILDANVTTAKIADANVTTAKIADAAVTTAKIADLNVTTAKLADASVLEGKIADNAVTENKILNANVTTTKIADLNVTTAKLAVGAVTTDKIADAAVTTVKIADANVTTAKIADAAVTTVKIADANVTTAKIADANVTTAKIADANVTTAKIADANVTTAKIADDAVTYAKIQNAAGAAGTILNWDGANWVETTVGALEVDGVIGNEVLNATVAGGLVRAGAGTNVDPYTLGVSPLGIVTGMIADGAVTTAKIADGAVTTAKIADANVTTNKILDANVTTAKILDANVTTAKIADLNVTTAKIANDAVTTAKILDANVTTAKIADANVTTAKIADDAVTTVKILDANVTTAKIADANVTTAKIADDAVTTVKILDANVTTAKLADASVIEAKIANNAVTENKILNANVTTTKIADLNVTEAKLAVNSVTTTKIADANVTTAKIADGAIIEAKIANNAVTENKILNANVTTAKIADLNVTEAKLAVDAVTTTKIANDAVTYAKIQNAAGAAGTILNWDGANWVETTVNALEVDGVVGNEVLNATVAGGLVRAGAGTNVDPYTLGVSPLGIVTGMIADGAILEGKIANNAVTENKILNGNVTTTKIADLNVTEAKLALGAVTSAKIFDGAIMNVDVNAAAAIAGTKIVPAFGAQDVSFTGSITQVGPALNTFDGDIIVNGTSDFNSNVTAKSLLVSTNAIVNGQTTHEMYNVTTADWTNANAEFLGQNAVSFVNYSGGVNVPLGTPGNAGSILIIYNSGVAFNFVGILVPAGEARKFINIDGTMTGWKRIQ